MKSHGKKAKKGAIVMFGLITPPAIMLIYGWRIFTREDLLPTAHPCALMFGHPETGRNGMRKLQGAPIIGVTIAIVMIPGDLQSRFSLFSI